MKIGITLIILLFSYYNSSSQSIDEFFVVNSNQEPIAYANIFRNKKPIAFTNEKGKFKTNDFLQNDTLTVSFLGYKTYSFVYKEAPRKITLENELFQLKELTVTNNKSVWLGYNGKDETIRVSDGTTRGMFFEYGVLIPNSNNFKGIFSKIKLTAGFRGKPKLPFRVNLYSIGANRLPEKNLMKEQIAFIPEGKKLKDYEFNIENQQIEIPADGFFIALEIINPNNLKIDFDEKFFPMWLGIHPKSIVGSEVAKKNLKTSVVRDGRTIIWEKSALSPLAASVELKIIE